jgi:hypothetical protein
VTFALYATGDIVEELLESAQLAAGATPGERLDLDVLAEQVLSTVMVTLPPGGVCPNGPGGGVRAALYLPTDT